MARIRPHTPLVIALLLLALPTQATAQDRPVNDDYLQSLRLNAPGDRLNRTDTLRDQQNTLGASVQADIFSTDRGGGPAEPTQCGATAYGRTVWYDFYPDVSGLARLRANGYDTVISVVPFDRRSATPNFAQRQCVNASESTTEEMLARVRAGGSYTVQVGGVADAGGPLEFLFDFLADTDGDGVLDDTDRCDRLDGPADDAGCPPRLRGDATLRARPTSNGIRVERLTVTATRNATVKVRCRRGASCSQTLRSGRTSRRASRLSGRNLRSGTRVEVFVTRRNAIGAYVRYTVRRGNFSKVERCLNPGSTRPRTRCG